MRKLLLLCCTCLFALSVSAQFESDDELKLPKNFKAPSKTSTVAKVEKSPELVQDSDTELEERIGFYDVYYKAGDFSDLKLTGGYGVRIGQYFRVGGEYSKVYLGGQLQALQYNFGLVSNDYTTDEVALGPGLLCAVSPAFKLLLPVSVLCSFAVGDNVKTVWGMDVIPQVLIGKKVHVALGVDINTGFVEGSKINCGLYVGLGF